MSVLVITKIPSPYQVELFDQISAASQIKLSVIYLRHYDPDRKWTPRNLQHQAYFLEDGRLADLENQVSDAGLVVFNWYRDPMVRKLIALRARTKLPWCFWGERPGFRFPGLFGRAYRRLMLHELYTHERVPIWGIGHWAIDGYKAEFGMRRPYYHVPYTSDLSRFYSISRRPYSSNSAAILFSGSFIERKGVMELCEAFLRIASGMPGVSLHLLGSGPLEGTLRKMTRVSDRVRFLGFYDWDNLQQAYANADILCAPSRYDGWGLIVLEGLASGMPVIASSSVGSANEVIKEGENGWLVAARNPKSLESSLRTALLLSPQEMSRIRRNCRASAEPYCIDAGANRFLIAAEETLEHWQA